MGGLFGVPGWAPTIGYIAVAGLALIGTGIALAVRYGSATPRGWRPDLVDRGYLRRRVPGWMTVAPLVAAAPGAFGIATGVLTAAVFAMVLICAAVGVILIVSVLQGNSADRHSGVTVRGDAELRRLRQRYRHLDPHRRPAMNTDTPRETAMGAAVFGPSAVREVAPELYGEFRDIRMRTPTRAGAGWARGGATIIGTGWGSGISTIGAESTGGFGVPSGCGGGGGRDGGGS